MPWQDILGPTPPLDLYEWAADNPAWVDYVEVGAGQGKSAAFLAEALNKADAPVDARITLVDRFAEGIGQLTTNLAHVAPRFKEYLVCDAIAGADILKARKKYVDFVYLNLAEPRSYVDVAAILLAWVPRMRIGGCVAGSGFSAGYSGLIEAVTAQFDRFEVWRNQQNGQSCWVARVEA